MAKEYVVIEDDRCYVDTPVFTGRGDCCDYKRQLIMTKEIFQECYKKWVLEEQEQRTGHWIDTGSGQECSECGEIQYGYDSFRKYCANCGAKMEVADETDD